MPAALFLKTDEAKGSGPSAALALAIFDLACPVNRPIWATYLASPCPLPFCNFRDRPCLSMLFLWTLLSFYAASPCLATAISCTFSCGGGSGLRSPPLRSVFCLMAPIMATWVPDNSLLWFHEASIADESKFLNHC
jgi:hypothetical protein